MLTQFVRVTSVHVRRTPKLGPSSSPSSSSVGVLDEESSRPFGMPRAFSAWTYPCSVAQSGLFFILLPCSPSPHVAFTCMQKWPSQPWKEGAG